MARSRATIEAPEWKKLTSPLFATTTAEHGMSIAQIPLPHSRAKEMLLALLPDAIARFMAHNLAMVSFLEAHMARE